MGSREGRGQSHRGKAENLVSRTSWLDMPHDCQRVRFLPEAVSTGARQSLASLCGPFQLQSSTEKWWVWLVASYSLRKETLGGWLGNSLGLFSLSLRNYQNTQVSAEMMLLPGFFLERGSVAVSNLLWATHRGPFLWG